MTSSYEERTNAAYEDGQNKTHTLVNHPYVLRIEQMQLSLTVQVFITYTCTNRNNKNTTHSSILYHITELLSDKRDEVWKLGHGYYMSCNAVEIVFSKERNAPFFRDKAHMGRAGAGLGLTVFWAVFKQFLLIILEPHVGHTKLPDF